MVKSSQNMNLSASVRSERKRLRWASKRFTVAMLAYLMLVLISAVIGSIGEYNLSGRSIHGFALWFLLFPAYLPLEFLGGICWFFEKKLNFAGHEALLLCVCDVVLAIVIWLTVKIIAAMKKSVEWLNNARFFVLIFVFWGIFQLLCCAATALWQYGGFTSLHGKNPTDCQSEKVVTVEDQQ